MSLNRKRNATLRLFQVGFLVSLGFLSLKFVQGGQVLPAMGLPDVTVGFKLGASSSSEAVSTVGLGVSLSGVSSQKVTVDYTVIEDSTASNTTLGSGKDYTLASGTLTFEPGVVTKNIYIPIVDDSINEADESIKVRLSNPSNAILSANNLHTYKIIDNDRKSLVDVVRDFGATGDGISDDTKAIQKAINTVYNQGGGVILFPPGVYSVTSVDMKENITYQGDRAVIKKPNRQGKWTRTFTTQNNFYTGNVDSKPLIIKGLTFDGNSKNQGAYQDYQLEQAHAIFLMGNPGFPGKLRAIIEDCTFKNGVADGISVYTNVAVKVYNCEAIDVFRGGFVLTGGNSSAEVYNLTTRGEIDATGIDIEVDGPGYGNSFKVDVKLENLNLIDGDFDISVKDGSTVIGNNIISNDGPFFISSLDSTMKFTNSKFKIGKFDGVWMNKIIFPHDVTFEDSEIIVTRTQSGRKFIGADVWWQHSGQATQQNQRLVFKNSSFKVDSDIRETDETCAIYQRKDSESNNNRLVLDGVDISNEFDVNVFKE